MLKKLVSVFTCLMLIIAASVAIAGGPPVPPQYAQPCAPAPAGGPAAAPSPYWGDAPFPGLCGGVVALPFLVVGSLLGGNPAGPPPPPAYGYGAPPPPPYPAPYGAKYAPPRAAGGSLLGGIPCMEMCTGLMGSITGSQGLL